MARIDDFIRSRAAMGWSRAMVGQALGLSEHKTREVISLLPDVKWVNRQEGVGVKMSHESRRGHCSAALAGAIAKARAAHHAKRPRYTIGSTVGTTGELWEIWGDLASVSYSQVRRRLRWGQDPIKAFFAPNASSRGWGNEPKDFKRGPACMPIWAPEYRWKEQ